MLRPRIIPCLLIKGDGLVKTVRFGQPKYVGDPINAVRIFNEKEADELMVFDTDATTMQRKPDDGRIRNLAVECRMPLCYGGGIKTVEQATRIIGLGVEKISLGSAAVQNPSLVSAIANAIGSQSVVVVLDTRRADGRHEVWTHNGTRQTGLTLVDAAVAAAAAGAGEIVVNSIDNDGVMKGYDLEAAIAVRRATNVPLTILGGAGSLDDIRALIRACGVVGAAAGSLFVFKGPYRAVLINYPNQAQKEALVRTALGG